MAQHTYAHIERTGASKAEIRRRARALRKAGQERGMPIPMQSAIDAVIDAAIEHAQGE